eukprot:7339054-Ditylum_brightwellii.AAC.1
MVEKISVLQTSNKQTKHSINKLATTLSDLNSTLHLHQNFINNYSKEGNSDLLLHNVKFTKFKEKLTSEIKETFKLDNVTNCNINNLSNKLSAIDSITQDHNKILSNLQINRMLTVLSPTTDIRN